jgi:hypothetical protein
MIRAPGPTPTFGVLRERFVSAELRHGETGMTEGLRRAVVHLAGLLFAAAATVLPAELPAQLVRGVVREAGTRTPLGGVVVSIHPAPGRGNPVTTLVATLSNAQGEYALSPNDTGHFVVSAKRIGVRQFRSEPISLARGATHLLDITVEGLRYALPVVTVSGATPCRDDRRDRDRIGALWEEARAALTASELSLRDRLVSTSMMRYERVLDPRSLNIRSETRITTRGVTQRAFVSWPAESLAVHGFARVLPSGMIEYFAPDELVLLSDDFVRDHCFGVAQQQAAGEVGITFEPVAGQRKADVEGTLWMDARTFELKRLEFRYTNFPLPVRDRRVGGEVHFARLASGAWHVSRWFMRVPQVEMRSDVTPVAGNRRVVNETPIIAALSEVGGQAMPEGATPAPSRTVLTGRVVDSSGAPLGGGKVALAGLPFQADVRADGSFRLATIPAGRHTLLGTHPDYDRLGLFAAEQQLTIVEGGESITLLQALGTSQILRQLCGYETVVDTIAAVRLILPPLAAADSGVRRQVHLSWANPRVFADTRRSGIVRTTTMALDLNVDSAGGVTACELPPGRAITAEERFLNGAPPRRLEFRSPAGGTFRVVEMRTP